MVLPVLADLLDHRIALFPQEPLVLREGVVFGHVVGVPGAGGDVPLPAVAAENALAGAGGPAAGLSPKAFRVAMRHGSAQAVTKSRSGSWHSGRAVDSAPQ